jgi:hypothetical protein
MAEMDVLRGAYASVASGEGKHLSEDQWEFLACDEMAPAEKDAALDHVLSCAECSRVHRAVLAIRDEAHAFDPGAPQPRPAAVMNRTAAWRRLLVGLATAAALISVFFLVRPLIRSGPAGPGGSQPITLRQGGHLAVPVPVSPVGRVQRAPDGLSWRAVQGARGYVVELLDGDGELLWKSEEITAIHTPWPKGIAEAPGRYYWRVLAIRDAGGEPIPSNLQAFEIGVSASRP